MYCSKGERFSFEVETENSEKQTSGMCRLLDTLGVFCKDDGQATEEWITINNGMRVELEINSRFKMPVNVTVKEPGTWIVGAETEGHIVLGASDAQNITSDRIRVIVCRATRRPYDVERVLDLSQIRLI